MNLETETEAAPNGATDAGANSSNSYFVPASRQWPTALDDDSPALHGWLGKMVKLLEPHTESDRHALMTQALVYFAATIGDGAHFYHEATLHRLNLYVVLEGPSGRGRKGTSRDRVRRIARGALRHVLPGGDDTAAGDYLRDRELFGLSSGEGLVAALCDRPAGESGETGEKAAPRPKPTLVYEPEFASPLQRMGRDQNTLSEMLRQAWEAPDLYVTTRADPLKATGTYLNLIGHITEEDVRRFMTSTLAGNGFGNRILWVCSKRARMLPFGGDRHPQGIEEVERRLGEAITYARGVKEMGMTPAACDLWVRAYPRLSRDRPGMFGKLCGRAEAQTRRIACLYALLDQQATVGREHLAAALALWEYCERSVRYVFGDALGDPLADTVLSHLRAAGDAGMTLTDLHDALGRNHKAAVVRAALRTLSDHKLATCRTEAAKDGGTKPVECWVATPEHTGDDEVGEDTMYQSAQDPHDPEDGPRVSDTGALPAPPPATDPVAEGEVDAVDEDTKYEFDEVAPPIPAADDEWTPERRERVREADRRREEREAALCARLDAHAAETQRERAGAEARAPELTVLTTANPVSRVGPRPPSFMDAYDAARRALAPQGWSDNDLVNLAAILSNPQDTTIEPTDRVRQELARRRRRGLAVVS